MGRKARWLIWSGYVGLWTLMLLLPGSAIDELPGRKLLEGHVYLVAKSLHVTAYALMTLLSAWLHVSARYRWLLVLFLMGHATVTEIIQEQVPGRTGALHDVAFDQIGVAIGLLLSWKWWTANHALSKL